MASAPDKSSTRLLIAAASGNLRLLKKMAAEIGKGRGIAKTIAGVKDLNGRGALLFAAAEGKTDVCKYLVGDLNFDVDTKDPAGETPLIQATLGGHLNTSKYLLDRGANPALSNKLGLTPLHCAAQIGHTKIVKLLLAKGAFVDPKNDSGSTPLQFAAAYGKDGALKILLEHGANAGTDVNVTFNGITPLDIAVSDGSSEIIECLLKAGADPNATNNRADMLKDKFVEAKSRGQDAFRRKQYFEAICAYSEAVGIDPCDATVLSNRSLCWIRLGQGELALEDAEACKSLKPDWPKACYRIGAAWSLLKKYDKAALAFFYGLRLDPLNEELQKACKEAVESGNMQKGSVEMIFAD